MYLDINTPQRPASCFLLQSILIPAHSLSSRTLKSAGSRYVLWAMCHLVPPAHPNRWWNRGAEAIIIKAEDVASLAPGLAALGKAKPIAWFLVKGRKCSPADSWSSIAMLVYTGQQRDQKENGGFSALRMASVPTDGPMHPQPVFSNTCSNENCCFPNWPWPGPLPSKSPS